MPFTIFHVTAQKIHTVLVIAKSNGAGDLLFRIPVVLKWYISVTTNFSTKCRTVSAAIIDTGIIKALIHLTKYF